MHTKTVIPRYPHKSTYPTKNLEILEVESKHLKNFKHSGFEKKSVKGKFGEKLIELKQ